MPFLRGLAASIAIFLTAPLFGAPTVMAQESGDADSSVVEAFQDARAAGDLNGALAAFNNDAVIAVQTARTTRVYAGPNQIRTYLQSVLLSQQTLMHSGYRSDGTYVRWIERDEAPGQSIDATLQAKVESGRISMLVVRQGEPFLSGAPSAGDATTQSAEVPSLAWPAALGLILMLCLGFVYRPRRRQRASELNGRLLRAMRQAHLDTHHAS